MAVREKPAVIDPITTSHRALGRTTKLRPALSSCNRLHPRPGHALAAVGCARPSPSSHCGDVEEKPFA